MAANALFKILTLQSRFFHNFFNIIPVLKREILMHCETNENFVSQRGINQTFFVVVVVSLTQGEIQN